MKIILFWLFGVVALFTVCGYFVSAMPGTSHEGGLPALTEDETAMSARLRNQVETLALEIGSRGAHQTGQVMQAQDYIENSLRRAGVSYSEQSFDARGTIGQNIEVELPGSTRKGDFVIVGAHYDTARRTPGADDNASGCAALIEIARLLQGSVFDRSVRLVFFASGEEPYLGTADMGSRASAKRSKERKENVVAMLSLDSIGIYKDAPGSQSVPFPLLPFYSTRADFLAFVGDLGSRNLVSQCTQAFRMSAQFPAEGAALPGWIPGIQSSDHFSFSQEGFPAVMVTDTGNLRSAQYGTPADTADRLDYDRLSRVVSALSRTIAALARRPQGAP